MGEILSSFVTIVYNSLNAQVSVALLNKRRSLYDGMLHRLPLMLDKAPLKLPIIGEYSPCSAKYPLMLGELA